jgi:hypothetical protein
MTDPREPRSRPWLNVLLIIIAVLVIGFGVCFAVVAGSA